MRLVIKYGGSSITSPKNIRDVAKFIAAQAKSDEVVTVCSATAGVTDNLVEISDRIRRGDKKVKTITSKIITDGKKLAKDSVTRAANRKKLLEGLEDDFAELGELVNGLALLGEVTPRSMDYLLSFGERISSRILAHAVIDTGRKAAALTGHKVGIITDSNFGQSRPLMDTTRLRVSKNIEALLSSKTLPVIGGFAGADQHGRITTFGRGGSDYTATIIGSCIKADEIWLMSDVDGLMTADPKIVKKSKVLDKVSYVEAVEMALFGAKQIHPRTFEPLLSKKIPMRIRSSHNTKHPGTLVIASPGSETKKTVKCVSTLQKNSLIDVRGGSMVGSPGTAARIFSTLASAGVNVMMISQNPSESSISIVVKKSDMDRAVNALEIDLLGKIIKKLEITTDVSIVALIGSGMRGTTGVASRVFGSIARRDLNVVMITQGSSELNLAFVVKDSDCRHAVQALHDEFELGTTNI